MAAPASGLLVGVATADDRASGYGSEERVASLVREALLAAGLGRRDPAAPLADVISRGASVLLKPNWVLHRNQSGRGMDCMVTHPTFVLAAVREVVAAGAGRIVLGDAPVQSADFAALTPPELRARLRDAAGRVPVELVDFRRVVADDAGGDLRVTARDAGDAVEFDLGRDSFLEPISRRARFRITSYDPRRLAAVQRAGVHRYLLSRVPFDVDVILNLPKLKTHGKAGITAALKNLVGVNADKNYLPHHRLGGATYGGDCYRGGSPLKLLAELCWDRSNRHIGRPAYRLWRRLATLLLLPHHALGTGDLEGRWSGNDTVWRMVLDLNTLLRHGSADGTVHGEPRRTWYTLTDAIVAGEGEGPLAPGPLPLGAVTFSSHPVAADLVHAALLRFRWDRVPLLRGAVERSPYDLRPVDPAQVRAAWRGETLSLEDVLVRLGVPAAAPRGWETATVDPARRSA